VCNTLEWILHVSPGYFKSGSLLNFRDPLMKQSKVWSQVKLVGVPAGRYESEIHCKFRLLFAKWVALLMFFEAYILYSSACVCECVESLIIIAESPTPSSPRTCHVVINMTSNFAHK